MSRLRIEDLRRLKYWSAAEYFASKRFASLRRRVMERFKGKCAHCGKPARWVHFWEPSLATLSGGDLRGVDAVCDKCWAAWRDADQEEAANGAL